MDGNRNEINGLENLAEILSLGAEDAQETMLYRQQVEKRAH